MKAHAHFSPSIIVLTSVVGGCTLAAFGQDAVIPPHPSDRPAIRDSAVPPATIIERTRAGISARPLGADASAITLPLNTIHLYQDANFKDDLRAIENVISKAPGTAHDLPGMMDDSLSSLRWNLAPGVVVMFFENGDATGERLTIWGSGESSAVGRWDFNDKASSWAWFYAGGVEDPSVEFERAAVVYPDGTVVIRETVAPIESGTLNLYKDDNFGDKFVPIVDVTAHPANTLHHLPEGMNDDVSSLRWNLPAGVVVMFYQDADGRKQQAAVWGNGEVANIDKWDFNDKISRWSWHYVGAPAREVLGYVPPDRTTVPAPVPSVVADRDVLDLVSVALAPQNKLDVTANDLIARKNPVGEGTFVYVPRTDYAGLERHLVWMVLDGKAYAVTAPAKMITPALLMPEDIDVSSWSRTGLSKLHAEDEAIKIVFRE